jgi:hypothetical protein
MWDKSLFTSFGGNSRRRIFTYVMSALVAAFLWVLFATTATHAVTTPASTSTPTSTTTSTTATNNGATWSNGSIAYQNNTYTGPKTADGKSDPKLPSGDTYYEYASNPSLGSGGTAYIIYFSTGVDPGTATTADYATYTISAFDGSFGTPSKAQKINITPNKTASVAGSGSASSASSCTVPGIGWIVCPVSNFLASGMDNVFNLLKGFLVVQPLGLTQTGSLYESWNYIRSIANVAFVIVFLIIIYSQITNIGISNYSIKKLLPRLIIAAILVNVSYIICAIAIDLSNVIGESLEQMLIGMRTHLASGTGISDTLSWQSVTSFVLAGAAGAGAATVSISGLIVLTGANPEAAIILLLPMLLGLLLAVLVALLVLSARQAVITILVVLAPIAFVAYLLPNTEKWFERWRKLFTDLLVFFPLFALVFGGSQLASFIIIRNAGGAVSITVVILALFVQVAPLVITPLLVRFSGEIVGKIAGIVNNPKKGILDQSRSWAKERSAEAAARNMARTDPVRNRQVFRRYALGNDKIRRTREEYKKAHENMSDARWANSQAYSDINQLSREGSDLKSTGEALSEARYNDSTVSEQRMRVINTNMRIAQTEVSNTKLASDVQYDELKAPTTALNKTPTGLSAQAIAALDQTQRANVLAGRQRSAQAVQQQEFARQLTADTALQLATGGISTYGKDASLANAIATTRKAYDDAVGQAREINKSFNLSSAQRQNHAMGKTFTATDESGNQRIYDKNSISTREAAIEDQLTNGTIKEVIEIVQESGSSNLRKYKTTISAAIAKSAVPGKTIFLGGKTIDDIAQGKIKNETDLRHAINETINKGKISERDLAAADELAVKYILEQVQANDPTAIDPTMKITQDEYNKRITQLSAVARKTITGDESVNVKPNAYEHILNIGKERDPNFDPNEPSPADLHTPDVGDLPEPEDN